MSYEYDNYLKEHRENVKNGLEWMRDNLPDSVIDKFAMEDALSEADQHDESKYSKEEYDAYDAYFYGDIKSHQVLQDFNKAWLHHQHMNPHHWQHWVLINDDPMEGTIGLEIPLKHIYEMVADWWSFSWAKENLFEIFNWYKDHQSHMILNQKTRFIVENILKIMFEILSNQAILEGIDIPVDISWLSAPIEVKVICHSDKDEDKQYGIPKLKKYPMPDKDHVRSAIKFFNYVDPKHEQELAESIIEKAEEYSFDLEKDISVGDENRFKKYLKKDKHLSHNGIKGQKWGIRNGPPYPLGNEEKLNNVKKINELMNSSWDYGVLDNGRHIIDTEDYDWDKNYRTIPVDVLNKEKIGVCWDFVNYQHDKLKKMGIDDESYLITIQKSDKPNDIVTHTFTTFKLGDKKYWLESAAWPKRGVHEINGIEDVAKELDEMYHSPGLGLSIFKYDPEGMDKQLTTNEFFERASKNLVYNEEPDENRFKKYLKKDKHLAHNGIKGQKWGVRRYQNSDGTLTEEGKKRYRKTVFVSGSSKTTTEDSGYFRKELPKEIQNELDKHISEGNKIIVGDAPGIDCQVQNYLNKKNYDNVEVYGPGKQVRYSANKKWKTNPVDAPEFEEGSKEWLAKKDIAMEKAADEGLAIILDEGSKATRKNVQMLINDDKNVKVFSLSSKGSNYDFWVPNKFLKDI